MHGYKPGRFSFNVKGGRCEACQGDGVRCIEMHFLPDVYVKCEECEGRRFNDATLRVKYKGHSVADVLDLTVREAGCTLMLAQTLQVTFPIDHMFYFAEQAGRSPIEPLFTGIQTLSMFPWHGYWHPRAPSGCAVA